MELSFPSGLTITNKGRALQAKAQTGVQLNFTKMQIGDGQLSGQLPGDMTALINSKKDIELTRFLVLTGGKAQISGFFSNASFTTGFYYRELGVFAQDPYEGEILYCYGNAGSAAEYIPAGGGADVLERYLSVVLIIGAAANVSATLTSAVYVTTQDLDAYTKKTDLASTSANKGASLVGLESISGLTATNVQDAIEQTFQFANNGKTDIADVIGSPVTSADTFSQIKSKIQTIKNTMASNLTAKGVVAAGTEALAALGDKIANIIKAGGNATNPDVLAGKTYTNDSGSGTGTMPNNGAVTITPSTSNQTIALGYHNGSGVVVGDTDLIAGNIKTGINIFNINGTFTADATATTPHLLTGDTAYVNGNKITGTMPNRGYQEFAVGTWTNGTGTLALKVPTGAYITEGSFGAGYVAPSILDTNFIASNIANGVTVLGLTGTNSNKKWASGTTTSSSITLAFTNAGGGGTSQYYIAATGLTFTPSKIILFDNTTGDVTVCNTSDYLYYYTSTAYGNIIHTAILSNYHTAYRLDGTNAYVTGSGFRLPCGGVNRSYTWYACE